MTADTLVKIHGDRMYRLALGLTGNRRDAEQVVRHALRAVLRKSDVGAARRASGAWLYRIVVKRASRRLHGGPDRAAEIRLEDVVPPFREDGRHAGEILDWSARVEAVSRGAELRGVVRAAIAELPAHYRSVLLLRDVEGLSNVQTARALRIAVARVKLRVHRARLFLQKRLALHFEDRGVADQHLPGVAAAWGPGKFARADSRQ